MRNLPLSAFALLSVHSLSAQILWNPTSGTNAYNTGANWNGGNVPTGSQTAAFNANGTQTVSFAATPTLPQNLTVGITSGTLTFESTGASAVNIVPSANIVLGTASGANVVVQKTGAGAFLFRSGGAFIVGNGGSNNTATVQGAGVTAGSSGSLIIVGFDNARDNLLHAKNGAALVSSGATIGRANNSDNNTVRLSDAGTIWTIAANPSSANLTLGASAGNDNNDLTVENGALLRSTVGLLANRGTVHLDGGTIDLTYDSGSFTTDQALVFQAAGRLRGQGTLKAAAVSSTAAGAIVEVGENGFGLLDADLTGAGWNNANIQLQLGLGNLTGAPAAGINYDFFDLSGTFSFGGSLVIDLAQAVLPGAYDIRLIGWTGTAGSSDNLAVSFINGSALEYSFESDGLYLSAVPEPSTAVLLAAGLGAAVFGTWRRRFR